MPSYVQCVTTAARFHLEKEHDMSEKIDDTGYKNPPRANRFKPGKSGNPNGRPKKQHIKTSRASLLAAILAEEVEIGGQIMTKEEALLRAALASAVKGSGTAIRFLDKTLADHAKEVQKGGVLVMPGTMPFDEWSAKAAEQQAKFREKDYGAPVPD